MLDLKEISYQPQTGERKIIDNLNLKVHENEIILICGNSGSGKTTLIEIISGLINPQKGKISWRIKFYLLGKEDGFVELYSNFLKDTL